MSGCSRRELAVVALASVAQLGFEMLVIKLGRYELGSLAIGAIGFAVLGVSLAGPLATWLGAGVRASRLAVRASLPLSVLAGAYFFSRPHDFVGVGHTYVAMLGCGVAALGLLALTSVPVFAALHSHGDDVPRVYAASLGGATVGAPLTLLAMHVVGDVGAYMCMVGVLGVVGMMLEHEAPRHRGLLVATIALSLVLCGVGFPRLDRAAHPRSVRIDTDAISRIDVLRRPNGRLRIRTAGVNAGTSTAGGTVRRPPRVLLIELAATPFRARPRRVLVLGSGAGRNVVQALAYGADEVVAVEINPMIPRAIAEMLPADADPYRDARVALVVGEGREVASQLAHEGKRFDLVYVPIATLFGGSGHTFTETYLMTREALAQYMGALAPGGTVGVFFPDVVRAKVVSAMARALADHGVTDPDSHLLVLARDHGFVLLARPHEPFGPDDRARYRGAETVEVPPGPDRILGARLRPLCDDEPFLYNDINSASGMRALYGWNLRFLRQTYLGALGVLLLVALVVVARSRSVPIAPRIGSLAAFVMMGVAYTALQTIVLQRLEFLVGHPVVATAIVLPMTLLGSAFGARLASRITQGNVALARGGGLLLLLTATIPFAVIEPSSLIVPGIAWPVRALFAAALAAVPFIPLGTYFPVAFARIERETPELSLGAWTLNGLGAVVGAALAIYGPMLFGFRAACLPALLAYAALTLWDAMISVGGDRRRAHLALGATVLVMLAGITIALECVDLAP